MVDIIIVVGGGIRVVVYIIYGIVVVIVCVGIVIIDIGVIIFDDYF